MKREHYKVMGSKWWWVMMWMMSVVVNARENVRYDGRSLIIDAQRRLLFSGSIHYPRSTPQMWPSLIEKAKEGGLDVIQTYVFWNLHEPKQGQYDFSGRHDLVKFIKEVQSQGLYVCLRIGPFIEGEWNYGGFPFWLHDVPKISYRNDNQQFKFYLQNFTTKIVDMMKSEGLYASQGGPIILSQIENEYGNIEGAFHAKGASYVHWAAQMAVNLRTGVPWVMCKQTDAPDPVINTCNGMRCGETFTGPNSPNKPSLWTENWTSFYQVYGGNPYIRSAQDIAFHTVLFIARNGSYVNYYMYHGGTNFGRTSSAYVITSYYDQAPLNEYGLLRQPKWGHLKELHAAIKNCSKTLLMGKPTNVSLGQNQEAYIFSEEEGGCVAFLINRNNNTNATIQFRNQSYDLLPRSISILQDCKNVIFNTAKVNWRPNRRVRKSVLRFDSVDEWSEYKDEIPNFNGSWVRANKLLEHMNMTKDESDYLWYTMRFKHNISCTDPVLHVESMGHVAHAFLNNNYLGNEHGNHSYNKFMMDNPIELRDGMNNISILSVMVGLPDSGAYLERRYAGLTGVEIQCKAENGFFNFTHHEWGYKVALRGENLQIYREENSENVEWSKFQVPSNKSVLTWYKRISRNTLSWVVAAGSSGGVTSHATSFTASVEMDYTVGHHGLIIVFDAPKGNDSLALNLEAMGKGEAWINGQSIGRYWVSFLTSNGEPSQSLYHVPRSFLKESQNLLVLFEEVGGNPLHITLDSISVSLHKYISNYNSHLAQ